MTEENTQITDGGPALRQISGKVNVASHLERCETLAGSAQTIMSSWLQGCVVCAVS